MTSANPALEISFERFSRHFKPGEWVRGQVVVKSEREGLSHSGLVMNVEGYISLDHGGLRLPSNTQFFVHNTQLSPPAKLAQGKTEFPFEFQLKPLVGHELHESFHGDNIFIEYQIKVSLVPTGFLARKIQGESQFIVLVDSKGAPKPAEVAFVLSTNDSLQFKKGSGTSSDEELRISGKFTSTVCHLSRPLTGELVIEDSKNWVVEQIWLAIMRVETVIKEGSNGANKKVSDIQQTQLVDGHVPENMAVPIYVVFPRVLTCPTQLDAPNYKIEFLVALKVLLQGGHVLRQEFPLLLTRCCGVQKE